MKMRNLWVRHVEVKWRLNYGMVEQTSIMAFHAGIQALLAQISLLVLQSHQSWHWLRKRIHTAFTRYLIRLRPALVTILAKWKLRGHFSGSCVKFLAQDSSTILQSRCLCHTRSYCSGSIVDLQSTSGHGKWEIIWAWKSGTCTGRTQVLKEAGGYQQREVLIHSSQVGQETNSALLRPQDKYLKGGNIDRHGRFLILALHQHQQGIKTENRFHIPSTAPVSARSNASTTSPYSPTPCHSTPPPGVWQ